MTKFTQEEKVQAVKRYFEGKESQKAIAESIGGSKAILQTWIGSISITEKVLSKRAIQPTLRIIN